MLASVPILFAWTQVCFRESQPAFIPLILSGYIGALQPCLPRRGTHHDGSRFRDWALTCLFFGQPLGASIEEYTVKRTQKVAGLLFVNSLLSLVLYTSLAADRICKSHTERLIQILLSEEFWGIEDVKVCPLLVAFGFNSGVSVSGSMVALLCNVKQYEV